MKQVLVVRQGGEYNVPYKTGRLPLPTNFDAVAPISVHVEIVMEESDFSETGNISRKTVLSVARSLSMMGRKIEAIKLLREYHGNNPDTDRPYLGLKEAKDFVEYLETLPPF